MNFEIPKLPDGLKDIRVNEALLHEIVITSLANKRHAHANTKTKGEVSGGGKRPWRQKGTGRARAGSNRSPLWRGGGIIFGPSKECSYSKEIPRKKKKTALQQAIVYYIENKNIKLIDDVKLSHPKTKEAAKFIKEAFGSLKGDALIVVDEITEDIRRSFRNINNITVANWKNINTYDLLKNEKILYSKKAWDSFLNTRLMNND